MSHGEYVVMLFKILNDVTTYTPCDNIYTIRSVKYNLDHQMVPLHFRDPCANNLFKLWVTWSS